MGASTRGPMSVFRQVAWFYGLTFAVSWGLWIPSSMQQAGWLEFPVPAAAAGLIGAYAPALVSLLLTAHWEGRQGVNKLLKRLVRLRFGIGYLLFASGFPVLLSAVTSIIAVRLGAPRPDYANPPVLELYPAPPEVLQAGIWVLLPMVFLTQWFGSSLGEEPGWRGFALPRLQESSQALVANLLIGFFWALWHLPRWWAPGQEFDLAGFIWFTAGLMLYSILFSWLFNSTGGSLAAVMLLHTSTALTSLFLSQAAHPLVETLLLAAAVGMVIWRGGAATLSSRPEASAGG